MILTKTKLKKIATAASRNVRRKYTIKKSISYIIVESNGQSVPDVFKSRAQANRWIAKRVAGVVAACKEIAATTAAIKRTFSTVHGRRA